MTDCTKMKDDCNEGIAASSFAIIMAILWLVFGIWVAVKPDNFYNTFIRKKGGVFTIGNTIRNLTIAITICAPLVYAGCFAAEQFI